jgi:uncharacterized protein YprB with RNaseH-like and TPR domain
MSWHTGRLAAFDIETTGVDPESDRIVTAAVADHDERLALRLDAVEHIGEASCSIGGT